MLPVVLLRVSMSACACDSGTSAMRAGAAVLSEDEKHWLYSAALAVSESPLDSETFKDCLPEDRNLRRSGCSYAAVSI